MHEQNQEVEYDKLVIIANELARYKKAVGKLKRKIDNRKIYKGTLLERIDDKISIFENNQKISIQMDTIEICRLVPKFE